MINQQQVTQFYYNFQILNINMSNINIYNIPGYSLPNIIKSHQIYMFAIWGISIDIPILIMRYGKVRIKSYMNLHSILGLLASLITIYYIGIMLLLDNLSLSFLTSTNQTFILIHFISALSLVGCMCCQIITGILIRSLLFSEYYKVGLQKLKIIHKLAGYITVIISRLTVTMGLMYYNNSLFLRLWQIAIGALYFILILFAILYRLNLNIFLPTVNNTEPAQDADPIYFKIVEMIEQNQITKVIFEYYPNAKYILYNNNMYYFDIFDHPGGEYIINQINGKQINYMFDGAHSSLVSPLRHTHSKYVWKYLSPKFIATIKRQKIIIANIQQANPEWVANEIIYYNDVASVFKFTSKLAKFRNSFNNISSLGKYFIIQSSGDETVDQIKRPYSMIICMTDDNYNHRKELKQLYKNIEEIKQVRNLEIKSYSETIPFIIKLYDDGVFTNYLHNFSHRNFQIHGPYGKGLEFNDSTKGYFVMIGAGTGVLPYLDLFQFLMKKIIYKVFVKKFGYQAAQRINPYKYNFQILQQVKIKFIGTFRNKSEFYGSSIVTDLYFLNNHHGFNFFDLELRYSNGQQENDVRMIKNRIDSQYIDEIVNTSPDRVYICGPYELMEQMSEHLENANYSRRKIYYV